MKDVNIKSDFYTFRNEIATEFGDFYSEQSDLFFERAVHFAKTGLPLTAISDAKFALSLSYYEEDQYNYIYLVGFLTQMHIDIDSIKKAKYYCEYGIEILNKDDSDYEKDLRSFSEMRDIIKGEEWKI